MDGKQLITQSVYEYDQFAFSPEASSNVAICHEVVTTEGATDSCVQCGARHGVSLHSIPLTMTRGDMASVGV